MYRDIVEICVMSIMSRVCVCVWNVCRIVETLNFVAGLICIHIYIYICIMYHCRRPSGARWADGQRRRPPGPVKTYLRDAPGWLTH